MLNRKKLTLGLGFCFLFALRLTTAQAQAGPKDSQPLPVIDMHFHANAANSMGPPPVYICAPYSYWPAWDPATGAAAYADAIAGHPPCAHPLASPLTDDELMKKSIAQLQKRNVIAFADGSEKRVMQWKQLAGERILPAAYFDPEAGKPSVAELREMVKRMHAVGFAEISNQYEGIPVTDPRMEPYFALAEELDLPVGIHMGPGPPGSSYFFAPAYRMKLSSLLQLEDVLLRHPKLRVYAMHAGWPLIDDAIAALYAHPQLYVDIGIISYAFPKKEFYRYLHRLIDAGFENRIMFGSDEMVWPETVSLAIDTIQNDPDLTEEQKRDILYNNAVRFLRIGKEKSASASGQAR